MSKLSTQRKAIISGAIAGLTFFYTSIPDPDIASKVMWLEFIGELATITLAAYYFVWVAPNEPSDSQIESIDPRMIGGPK